MRYAPLVPFTTESGATCENNKTKLSTSESYFNNFWNFIWIIIHHLQLVSSLTNKNIDTCWWFENTYKGFMDNPIAKTRCLQEIIWSYLFLSVCVGLRDFD